MNKRAEEYPPLLAAIITKEYEKKYFVILKNEKEIWIAPFIDISYIEGGGKRKYDKLKTTIEMSPNLKKLYKNLYKKSKKKEIQINWTDSNGLIGPEKFTLDQILTSKDSNNNFFINI
jgi:hypothetical protein